MKKSRIKGIAYILLGGSILSIIGCVLVGRKAHERAEFESTTNSSDVDHERKPKASTILLRPKVSAQRVTPVPSTVVSNANEVPSNSPTKPPSSHNPTALPTEAPTPLPSTIKPTSSPTLEPTDRGTNQPSTPAPTRRPTKSPATESPTAAPVDERIKPNPVPDDPPRGYFNYDTSRNSEYGPDRWTRVSASRSFLREFSDSGFGAWKGTLDDPTRDRCFRDDKQSPIDLQKTEDGCEEHHMIRPRLGAYSIDSDEIEKRIEGNKLRLNLNRRECLDLDDSDCRKRLPPLVDFPKYSGGGNSDMINFDIKYPSEHWMEGEAYDAEIQMMHLHQEDERVASIGVLVRASADGYNSKFQEILDEFQAVYDSNMAECEASRRQRRLGASLTERMLKVPPSKTNKGVDHAIWGDYSTYLDDPDQTLQRKLQSRSRFNPYDRSIMRTIYFYRYEGSITEPPCYLVTWFILTKSMKISYKQLAQIKKLIFTHVDSDCEKTSLHFDDSVARPLQPIGDRTVTKCTKEDFVHDDEK